MESKNDLGVRSVTVTVFSLLASFEAGYSLKNIMSDISAWQALVYAVGVGTFIAISAVVLYQFLVSSGEK